MQHFFGTVRQAIGPNGHPDYETAAKVFNLLSLYKLLRPPKTGNCKVSVDNGRDFGITMQEFQICFPKVQKKSDRLESIAKLQNNRFFSNYIKFASWNCTGIDNFDLSAQEKFSVYNICGSYVHKMLLKKIECNNCRRAFMNSSENLIQGVEETTAVEIDNRGGLVNANLNLVNLCLDVEMSFSKFISDKRHLNIYNNTIQEMSRTNLTFPCDVHKTFMVTSIVHDYLILRMRQKTKFEKRNQDLQSKNLKKMPNIVTLN